MILQYRARCIFHAEHDTYIIIHSHAETKEEFGRDAERGAALTCLPQRFESAQGLKGKASRLLHSEDSTACIEESCHVEVHNVQLYAKILTHTYFGQGPCWYCRLLPHRRTHVNTHDDDCCSN